MDLEDRDRNEGGSRGAWSARGSLSSEQEVWGTARGEDGHEPLAQGRPARAAGDTIAGPRCGVHVQSGLSYVLQPQGHYRTNKEGLPAQTFIGASRSDLCGQMQEQRILTTRSLQQLSTLLLYLSFKRALLKPFKEFWRFKARATCLVAWPSNKPLSASNTDVSVLFGLPVHQAHHPVFSNSEKLPRFRTFSIFHFNFGCYILIFG